MKFCFSLLLCAFSALLLIFNSGCATEMLPSEDIEVFEKHKDIIEVLKSNKFSADSKEKYEAALSLSKKVDFSYTRTVKFLSTIFLDSDARVNRQDESSMVIIMYYPYKDGFVSFEFHRYNDHILKTVVRYK